MLAYFCIPVISIHDPCICKIFITKNIRDPHSQLGITNNSQKNQLLKTLVDSDTRGLHEYQWLSFKYGSRKGDS